jgi:hypothetical protein
MPLNSLVSWFIKKRVHQIDLFRKYPSEVQRELFAKLIERGKQTEWGKVHSFGSVKTVEDFKKANPIQEYPDVQPYVERIMAGEQNVLWNSEIKWFAKSSGTTSASSKFIPVSKEAIEDCHYKGGKDLLALYFSQNQNVNLYSGKTFIIGGSGALNTVSNKAYSGDLSAIIIKNLPFWVERRRTPDMDIALMDGWEEKIEKMARVTSKENVTNLSGVPSWTLVLLKRILEVTGKKHIHEVWPNLQLYMHGGVNFEPYRKQFEQLLPDPNLKYYESYNASEGFFSLQDENYATDMLLMLDYGIFFEFIPLENFGTENPDTLGLEDVELGKNYVPVISTNAGLWRYVTGDTIVFTQKYPFKIKISGRTKSFLNAFGEELIVENADRALAIASEKCAAFLSDYTAAPIYMEVNETGAHEWVLEFEKPPKDLEAFISFFDKELKFLNTDYAAKRTGNLTLREPIIRVLEKGTFYKWFKANNKLGGQNKVPRLSNDRKYVDEILSFSNYYQHKAV